MKMGFPCLILRKYMIVPSIQINQCVYNELHFCKKKLTCCICLYLPPTHEGENSANIEIIGVGRLKHSLTSSLGNEPACLRSQAGVEKSINVFVQYVIHTYQNTVNVKLLLYTSMYKG